MLIWFLHLRAPSVHFVWAVEAVAESYNLSDVKSLKEFEVSKKSTKWPRNGGRKCGGAHRFYTEITNS